MLGYYQSVNWNLSDFFFYQNRKLFMYENESKIIVWEVAAILSRGDMSYGMVWKYKSHGSVINQTATTRSKALVYILNWQFVHHDNRSTEVAYLKSYLSVGIKVMLS